jgi:hypothetical protein
MPVIYQNPSDQERKFFEFSYLNLLTQKEIHMDDEYMTGYFLSFYRKNAPDAGFVADVYIYDNKHTGDIDLRFNIIGNEIVYDEANPGTSGFDDPRVIRLLEQMYISIDPAA